MTTNSDKQVRLRFAPSPTGPLHIGGVRTALYNYLYAKQHGGKFILRIEDTDRTRYVEGAESYIKEALAWCGLHFDEGPDLGGELGPYRQSERQEMYGKYVQQLVDNGYAYYAFDTPEELDEMRRQEAEAGNHAPRYDSRTRVKMRNSLTLSDEEVRQRLASDDPYTVRLHLPAEGKISFQDEIRGEVTFATRELDDKVILKGDGWPTYHVANVIDDYSMQISHVIRGEEWLSSTAHHIFMYKGLGWTDHIPTFAHLPLLLKPVGKGKLSKRDGQKFGFPVFPLAWEGREAAEENFPGFDTFGFLPQAVINFLAFLGWNPGDEQEIFSMVELQERFALAQVSKSGARFDFEKARWFNQQHLQNLSLADFQDVARPFLAEVEGEMQEDNFSKMVALLQPRIHTLQELPEAAAAFVQAPTTHDEKTLRKKWKEEIKPHFAQLVSDLVAVEDFTAEDLKAKLSGYLETHELSFGQILPLLRIALTGVSGGPDLFTMMEIIGRDAVAARFAGATEIFNNAGTPT